MLKLDEKKIRKGRPIGLPYQGSKKKISKKVVEIIKQNFGTNKPVYDIFGGGGAITAECMLNGLDVHYNDLDKTITDIFERVISQDREWLKTLIVSRDEFLKILEKENKTVDDNLKLLVNSFSNNRKSYLYSKENSGLKYNLAIEIINKHDIFSEYKQTDTYKKVAKKNELLQQLHTLQQLQRLQQLYTLRQPKVTNIDYTEFSNIEGAILYLDPPYEGTTHEGYSIAKKKRSIDKVVYKEMRDKLLKLPLGTKIEHDDFIFYLGTSNNNKNRMYYKDVSLSFNSQAFYDWAYKMSKKNIVLISSYEILDDRFEYVYEFETARSNFSSGGYYGTKTEKLFMVK